MKPREFITAVLLWLATSLSVCPGVAFAQSSLPVVAILRATGDESASVNRLFRQAAREIGHEDGRTIRIVEYSAQNDITRLPGLSAVVVAERPAVVVAMGPAAARAMKAASSSVPIVAFTSFPVESGLAASLARPGGNLTGVSLITTELDAKRLSLLGEFIPKAKRIAVLRDPAVSAADHIPQLEATARSLGVALEIVEASRPDAIEAAVQLARSHGVEALSVLASPMLNGAASEIARQAKQASLPTMCQWREMAEAGCMVSYGASFAEAYRLTAAQMDRVLRGANPAELPIQQPTRFELVVNLTTARELGLVFPASLLARADELIE